MPKSFQVLLIEDDKTLGSALLKALKKAGIDTYLAHGPEAAQTLCNHCDFSVIVADCMLPRMDGVSLIQSLLPQLTTQPTILLMTGVFKDRGFLSEAKKKTGAKEILSKPFEVNDFTNTILSLKMKATTESTDKEKSVIEHFCQSSPNLKEIIKSFTDNKSIDGREIPFLLSLLWDSHWTGALHVQTPHGSSGVIYVDDGKLIQVFLDDAKSLLGHLLMDLGFVEPDDLEAALTSEEKSPIGQKLIKRLSISPHALELALSEQTVLRLSQLITPELVQLRLSPGARAPAKKASNVSPKRIHQLFNEWGESKYDIQYLHDLLGPCMKEPVQTTTPDTTEVSSLDEFISNRPVGAALEALLKREVLPTYPSDPTDDLENLRQKYRKLRQSLKAKNHFEVLGLSTKALSQEIEKAYLSLKNSMRSNLRNVSDPEVLELCNKIDHRIERAYSVLSDDVARQKYLSQLQVEQQQELMAKEPEYDLAISLLNSGKFKDAHQILKRLHDAKYNFPDLTAYLMIAQIKAEGRHIHESDLSKISPENRQSGAYLMAKALAFKAARNYPMAIQYFRRSLVYNRSSQLASKEIASCLRRLERQRSQNTFLGSFMDGLLGGPKKKAS